MTPVSGSDRSVWKGFVRRPQSADRLRPYHNDRRVDDSAAQPVNYSGTQVNIFGQPNAESLRGIIQSSSMGNFSTEASAINGAYPYGQLYPPAGFTNQVQLGFMTEHMLRKLDESRLMTMSALMRNAYPGRTPEPFVQEPPSPRAPALEYDVRAKPVSPGNGDWRGQIAHIYAHLLEIASEDRNFRINIGEPKLGEIVAADLEEDQDSYTLTLRFSKPYLGRGTRIGVVAAERASNNSVAKTPMSEPRSFVAEPRRSSRRPVESVVKKQIEREEEIQYEKENIQQDGTLKPYKQFSAEQDADALRKAMKGLGTDEDAITNILSKRSSSQRQEIMKTYKTMFGKDLAKDLKSELSGDYWKVIKALCLPHADYDAVELRNAIKGLGTDDSTLVEIICSRTNKSLAAIQEAYKRLFNKRLEEDIADDTSGHYRKLLISLLQANRDESNVINRNLARSDAKAIHDAGVQRWGTDESRFNAILVSRSYPQLRATFSEYEKLAGRAIEEAIRNELSGDVAKGLLTIVQCVRNKWAYFAQRLEKAMKGLGTDDDALIRIIVSRSEVDMVQIKAEFQQQFRQSLAQWIADDTSGDYRKILLSLLGESALEQKSAKKDTVSDRQASLSK